MAIVKATLWLNDRIWEIEREHSFADETHVAYSYLLCCPLCSRIWFRHILRESSFVWPRAGFCEQCAVTPDRLRPVPGSILIQEGLDLIDDQLLEALPPELLKREFDLHIKALDNGNLELRDFSSKRSQRTG